jgi:hypothetical protein
MKPPPDHPRLTPFSAADGRFRLSTATSFNLSVEKSRRPSPLRKIIRFAQLKSDGLLVLLR